MGYELLWMIPVLILSAINLVPMGMAIYIWLLKDERPHENRLPGSHEEGPYR